MDYKKDMLTGTTNKGRFREYIKNLDGENKLETGLSMIDDPYLKNDINLDWLILLNKHNSEIIERLIQNDDGYIQFTKMLVEYHVLSSSTEPKEFPYYDRSAVLSVVRMIDIENSTNVWRFNRDKMYEMVDYIVTESNNFWTELVGTDGERKELVKKLANSNAAQENADDTDEGESDKKAKPSSLASKVCKYFAQYIFDNGKQEKYFINDYFVRRTLKSYYHFYMHSDEYRGDKLTNDVINGFEYDDLFNALDLVLNKANEGKQEKITRGEMDHIMWYCYKNSGDTRRTIYDEELYEFCEKVALICGVYRIDKALECLNKKYKSNNPESENKKRFHEEMLREPEQPLPYHCVVRGDYLVDGSLGEEKINDLIALASRTDIYDVSQITKKPKPSWAVFENGCVCELRNRLLEKGGRRQLIDNKINELLDKLLKGEEIDLAATYSAFDEIATEQKKLRKNEIDGIHNRIDNVINKTRLPHYLGHTKEEYDRLVSAS